MPTRFQLLASHPALDFVNTWDNRFVPAGPHELMPQYVDLLAFADQSKLLDARQIAGLRQQSHSALAERTLRRAHELRETLAAVFYPIAEQGAPAAESLKCLEPYVVEARTHQTLVWPPAGAKKDAALSARWEWEHGEDAVELPLWAIAQSSADLLTSHAVHHVHECASRTCRWLFLDTTKNHSRRWCDMTICGNRMKARRFQARQQSE